MNTKKFFYLFLYSASFFGISLYAADTGSVFNSSRKLIFDADTTTPQAKKLKVDALSNDSSIKKIPEDALFKNFFDALKAYQTNWSAYFNEEYKLNVIKAACRCDLDALYQRTDGTFESIAGALLVDYQNRAKTDLLKLIAQRTGNILDKWVPVKVEHEDQVSITRDVLRNLIVDKIALADLKHSQNLAHKRETIR